MQYKTAAEIVAELRSRISYSMSQKDVAAEIGVTTGHLSDVLAGKKGIGAKITKALGYDPTPYFRRGKS
jgi:transcriptional regulator with XRE-family HTH domain